MTGLLRAPLSQFPGILPKSVLIINKDPSLQDVAAYN